METHKPLLSKYPIFKLLIITQKILKIDGNKEIRIIQLLMGKL